MSDAVTKRNELIAKAGCLVVAGLPALYIYFGHDVRLKYFVFGSGSWGFGVMLKMAFHALVMNKIPKERVTTRHIALLSGFVSGITELGLALLFLSFLGELTFWQVMAFGVGIGAIEAWVVATTPNLLKGTVLEEGVQSLETAITQLPHGPRFFWQAIAGIIERILAMAVHIGTRGLVYVAIRTFNVFPALLALTAFVMLDGVLGFRTLMYSGPDRIRRLAQFYFWFALIAAVLAVLFGWYWWGISE